MCVKVLHLINRCQYYRDLARKHSRFNFTMNTLSIRNKIMITTVLFTYSMSNYSQKLNLYVWKLKQPF